MSICGLDDIGHLEFHKQMHQRQLSYPRNKKLPMQSVLTEKLCDPFLLLARYVPNVAKRSI